MNYPNHIRDNPMFILLFINIEKIDYLLVNSNACDYQFDKA